MCTVVCMSLAGIPVAARAVRHRAASLREVEEMLELRATLVQEHVWRQREGL
jgi:hypothetical protein